MASAAKSNNAENKHCLGPEGYSCCHLHYARGPKFNQLLGSCCELCHAMCCTCLCVYSSVCFLSRPCLLMTSMASWLLSTSGFCSLISACPSFLCVSHLNGPKKRDLLICQSELSSQATFIVPKVSIPCVIVLPSGAQT